MSKGLSSEGSGSPAIGARLSDALAYRRLGDTYVVIHTDGGRMCFLNQTAGAILEAFDRGVSDAEMAAEICRVYGIDGGTAARDYAKVRASFLNAGILENPDSCVNPSVREVESAESGQDEDQRARIKQYCTDSGVPLQAFIEISPACNLRCTHCYIPAAGSSAGRLDLQELYEILDELKVMGCLELVITGGEPLADPRFVALCEYARNERFSVVVKTNATLLDDGFIAHLRRLHVTEVQVSLYSMDAAVHDSVTLCPGSHSRTVAALKRCHEFGQPCRISCVVMKSNFMHLDGLTGFAKSIGAPLGFDLLVTRALDGTDRPLSMRLGPDDLRWLDERGVMGSTVFEGSTQIRGMDESAHGLSEFPTVDLDSRVCGAACTLVAIDAWGNVRPCIAFPLTLGNVRGSKLHEILSKDNPLTEPILCLRNRSFVDCQDCDLVAACPRCIAAIYQETGTLAGRAAAICEIALYHNKYGGQATPTVT